MSGSRTLHLKLSTQSAGTNDELVQRFGFREFWIEGQKSCFSTAKSFGCGPTWPTLSGAFVVSAQREKLRSMMEWGFNFAEFWPGDVNDRSHPAEYRLTEFYRSADEVGMPISGIMPHMGWMGSQFDSPQKVAAFEASVQRDWREGRNHPAIIMWGSSGNMTGGDINPLVIGQREKAAAQMTTANDARNADFAKSIRLGPQGIALIKKYDPTRPVFIHHGGPLGDIYTLNNYLTGIPLQEREEWLTHYIKSGDMPLWYVEWGTPHSTDFFRGRKGYGPTIHTEPLHTEHYATLFGTEAYKLETKGYRDEIRTRFKGGQEYDQFHENWAIIESPAFLKLQALYQTNTLRSFRTFGLTGGMIPWSGGYAERNGKITPAGEAMKANNGPTLAWIAGPARAGDVAASPTKRTFSSGQSASKSAWRSSTTVARRQPYEVNWRAVAGAKPSVRHVQKATSETGSTSSEPLAFTLPHIRQDHCG
jgi:beta-galactosidase